MTKCNVWKKQRWIYCSPLLVLLVLLYVSPAFYSNCNYIDAYMPSILQALFGIPGSINVGQSLDSMVRQILRHTYLAIQITLYWNSKLRRRLECFPSESRAPSQRGVIDTLGLMRLMLRSISSNPKRLCLVVYPEGKRSVEWQKAPLIGTIDWMRLFLCCCWCIYKKAPSGQLHSSIGSWKNWVSFAAVLHHVEERLRRQSMLLRSIL